MPSLSRCVLVAFVASILVRPTEAQWIEPWSEKLEAMSGISELMYEAATASQTQRLESLVLGGASVLAEDRVLLEAWSELDPSHGFRRLISRHQSSFEGFDIDDPPRFAARNAVEYAAAFNSSVEVIRFLIDQCEESKRERELLQALELALELNPSREVVHELTTDVLSRGLESRGIHRRNFFGAAKRNPSLEVIEYLMSSQEWSLARAEGLRRALHLAMAWNPNLDAVERIAKEYEGAADEEGLVFTAVRAAEDVTERLALALRLGVPPDSATTDGVLPLMILANRARELKAMSALVQAGALVNDVDFDGATALMHACDQGAPLSVVRWLVENGSEVDQEDDFGMTALFHALSVDRELSWEAGRYAMSWREKRERANGHAEGRRASQTIQSIYYLLDQGARLDGYDKQGRSAVQLALLHRNDGLTMSLLERGAPLEVRSGTTPLILLAVENGASLDVIKQLKALGASVRARGKSNRSSLMLAIAAKADIKVVEYLLGRSISVHESDFYGRTVFEHWAASNRSIQVLNALEKAGMRVEDNLAPKRVDKWYPGFLRTEGESEVLRKLNRWKIPLPSRSTRYPNWLFEFASVGRDPSYLPILLEGGNSFDAVDSRGNTPFLVAVASNSSPGVMQTFLDYGADANATDLDGRSALELLALNRRVERGKEFEELVARLLLESGRIAPTPVLAFMVRTFPLDGLSRVEMKYHFSRTDPTWEISSDGWGGRLEFVVDQHGELLERRREYLVEDIPSVVLDEIRKRDEALVVQRALMTDTGTFYLEVWSPSDRVEAQITSDGYIVSWDYVDLDDDE